MNQYLTETSRDGRALSEELNNESLDMVIYRMIGSLTAKLLNGI